MRRTRTCEVALRVHSIQLEGRIFPRPMHSPRLLGGQAAPDTAPYADRHGRCGALPDCQQHKLGDVSLLARSRPDRWSQATVGSRWQGVGVHFGTQLGSSCFVPGSPLTPLSTLFICFSLYDDSLWNPNRSRLCKIFCYASSLASVRASRRQRHQIVDAPCRHHRWLAPRRRR